jgi:hypothetical protein
MYIWRVQKNSEKYGYVLAHSDVRQCGQCSKSVTRTSGPTVPKRTVGQYSLTVYSNTVIAGRPTPLTATVRPVIKNAIKVPAVDGKNYLNPEPLRI